MLRRLTVVLGAWVALTGWPAGGNAQALFAELSKDFGSVPRGTLLTHQFRFTNTTQLPLHVAAVRSSCTCATPTIDRAEIPPGEATAVTVSVDTRKFAGLRTFTIYIQFDQPFVGETRLTLQANSREDVAIEPSYLAFGRIRQGSSPTASVTIEYRGIQNWQITGVENDNGYLQVQLQESPRRLGLATYHLTATLHPNTPVGAWHADVWLKTNDAATPRIRVPLTVEVEGMLTATPRDVLLGRVKPGGSAERKVVVRGPAPFQILKIEGVDEHLHISAAREEVKAFHVLRVHLKAGQEAGELSRRIRVYTDLPNVPPVEFTVQAQVSP
jgi:hypothetical protein